METRTPAKRVETLEIAMEGLNELPARVARLDDRVASLDGRVALLDGRVALLDDRAASLEGQFLQFREEVRGEFSALRVEMRAGDEETRRELGTQMRVLHEEVLERLTVIGGRKSHRRKRS